MSGGHRKKKSKGIISEKINCFQLNIHEYKASFSHTDLFSLCVNAAAVFVTCVGNRQLKLTRQRRFPAEQHCQVEQASTPRVKTDWKTD